jgi:hypothetical protein
MAYKTLGTDRILEVAAAPGTGAVALGGAVAGYRTFASVAAAGDTYAYFIEAVDTGGTPTGLWERGFGTFSVTPSFARTTVIDGSSGAATLVNFTTSVRIGVAPMTETTLIYPAPGGRLSVAADAVSPVGDSPTNGLSSIYYMPYLHDRITLWNGSGIQVLQFGTTTINLPSGTYTANTAWDIFGYITPGRIFGLETLAWTNNTTRATSLAYLNGFLCKSTDATRRYLGSFYVQTAGVTHDYGNVNTSAVGGKRFLWNMYNRVPKFINVYDQTATWTYAGAAWRAIRGVAAPTNCVEMFRGLADDAVIASGSLGAGVPSSAGFQAGIGSGGIPYIPSLQVGFYNATASGINIGLTPSYMNVPAIGYLALSLTEFVSGGTITFGNNYGTPELNANVLC